MTINFIAIIIIIIINDSSFFYCVFLVLKLLLSIFVKAMPQEKSFVI